MLMRTGEIGRAEPQWAGLVLWGGPIVYGRGRNCVFKMASKKPPVFPNVGEPTPLDFVSTRRAQDEWKIERLYIILVSWL